MASKLNDTNSSSSKNTESSKLFFEINDKNGMCENGRDFRYNSSKRIVEIIKTPWNLWKPNKNNRLALLPIEIMSKIGEYLPSEDHILLYKIFALPWFTSSDALAIKILKECMKSLDFASHPTLTFPPDTFDPRPHLPPINLYRSLGDKIDRKVENFDAKVKLFQHLRTMLGKKDIYKYESLDINDHSFKMCLHCVIPAIIIDDVLINTNLRRRQSFLSISNVDFNSGPVRVEVDCINCHNSLALNAMQKSQFNLHLLLPIVGRRIPRGVVYSNFITSKKTLWTSRKCYIQTNESTFEYESIPYDCTNCELSPAQRASNVVHEYELDWKDWNINKLVITESQQQFDDNRASNDSYSTNSTF